MQFSEIVESLLSVAFPLFLLMDPIGNVPIYLAVLKNSRPNTQKRIVVRELLIALAIILLFYFVGDYFLEILDVRQYTVMIAGGIILFLIALRMIFPQVEESSLYTRDANPFIVPLAVPLVAGPAILTAVILYSHESYPAWAVLGGIFIAWLASTVILACATSLQRLLKARGIATLEKLMGLILTLIAVQMFLQGFSLYQGAAPS